jgi:predicted metal-dependent hydrolase
MEATFSQVVYGKKRIEFQLLYANRKSLGIKVMPNCSVQVVAPFNATINDINQRVKEKAKWIITQQLFFDSYNPSTPKRKYVNGETHLYLGRQYKLQIIKSEIELIIIYRGKIIIQSKDIHPASIEIQLKIWYKQKANKVFSELLDFSMLRFKKYKIDKPTLMIRAMSKRWGSCTPSGKIILNTELIKASKRCIEYVIIHELCHLVHYNHTKDFFNLLSKMNPDWKKEKEKLEIILS